MVLCDYNAELSESLSGLKPQACSPLRLSLQRICSGARISAHPNKSAIGSVSSAPHSGVRNAPERLSSGAADCKEGTWEGEAAPSGPLQRLVNSFFK